MIESVLLCFGAFISTLFQTFDFALRSVAGLLPIPAQTWGSQPIITNRILKSPVKTGVTDASTPKTLEEEQPNQEPRIEAEKSDQNQELEEEEEAVVIRRVGFVFLAYNVEFW